MQFTTAEDYDNGVAAGAVIGFDPPAGTELKRDQVVTVVVSKGHEPVAVPDVTGQTPEQAQANLEAARASTVKQGDDGRSADVDIGEVMAVTRRRATARSRSAARSRSRSRPACRW